MFPSEQVRWQQMGAKSIVEVADFDMLLKGIQALHDVH